MSQKDFINKQKILYKSFKSCFCPAIQETVYFTSDGLNHLFYHRRRPRNIQEKTYRAALIPYIIEVLENAKVVVRRFDTVRYGPHPLLILEHEISALHKGKRQVVKVILQQKGLNSIHFLSVMRRQKD